MRLLAALLIAATAAVVASDLALAQAAIATAAAPAQAGFAVPAWLSNIWAYISTPAAVSGIVGFFMAILPQGSPGTVWGYVRVVLDFVASNWGAAKNIAKA